MKLIRGSKYLDFKFKLLFISIISLSVLSIIRLFHFDYNISFGTRLNEIIKKKSSELHADNAKKENKSITRIIHQSWRDDYSHSTTFNRYIESWKKCFPNWQYKLWTNLDNRQFVKKFYPWFLSLFDSFSQDIYRIEVSRYLYMFHYGGIYTDLDNECLKPFEHLLMNNTLVFGDNNHVPLIKKFKGYNYVQNSFMYSVPNHPFWLELLLEIFHSVSSFGEDPVTGPLVLSNMIEKYRSNHPVSSKGIKIYPAHFFNPITFGGKSINGKSCKAFNLLDKKEYNDCKIYHKAQGSYVVQFHTDIWG